MSIRLSARSSSAFIAGAVVALVLGTGTAYAANGGTFRLGRSNSATATTTLTNTHGTALTLNSKAGQPSLRVNRNTKIPSLNSDLLDGVDSGSFARVTTVGSISDTGFVDDNETPDQADDDTVIAVAVCPAGSQVVGGGGGDFTDDGTLFYSAPDGVDAWLVASTTAVLTADNAANVEADARCWNPRRNVTSNMRMTQAQHTISLTGRRAIERAAAKN